MRNMLTGCLGATGRKDRAKTLSFDILYVLGSCQKVTVS